MQELERHHGFRWAKRTLSDRYGRRPIMLIGLSLSVAGLLIYSVADVFQVLLVSTIVRRIGLAFAWPVVTALLADPPRQRVRA